MARVRDVRCYGSHLGTYPNSSCGIKESALSGSALGREGSCQLAEGLRSPSRDLAVIPHCLPCQGEGLRAPAPAAEGVQGEIPGDQHSDGFGKNQANGEAALPGGRKPSLDPKAPEAQAVPEITGKARRCVQTQLSPPRPPAGPGRRESKSV